MLSAASAPHTSVLAWFDGGATSDIILYPVLLLVLCGAVQSVQIRSISPGQKWPGFYFAPLQYSHIQAFTAAFLSSMQFMRPKRQNRLQGFTVAFPLICSIPAHAIQQPHKPPIHRLRSAGGHTVKCCTSTNTRYHRHAGRCTGQRSRPIIIRYTRARPCYESTPDGAADCRPCQPGGVSVSTCTGSARRLAIWHRSAVSAHPPPGRAVQQPGRGGRRGTIDGYRRISFRAFAR